MDEAGGVEVDVEVCGGENVLLDARVLADSEPDAPAVVFECDRPAAGREADRLLATEIALAVGDIDAVRPDLQHADVGAAAVDARHWGADERDAVCFGACLDDRHLCLVLRRDGLSVELVTGQRHLWEHDQARACRADQARVRSCV
jgi:hypothetical protein